MNVKLQQAALQLVKRAAEKGKRGKTAGKRAMAALVRDSKDRIPVWYVELITTVPLCGLQLGWKSADDPDFIEWMEWSGPENIRSETLECYPGLAILERGYVNVAIDPMGSGDPFFISTGKSQDPPLYQVYHDISEEADEILADGRTLIAKSLSAFFRKAIIEEE